mgnify:CR=1 FL=1
MNEELSIPILLHVCCAPCSGVVIERLREKGFLPTIFFYNPNIYPFPEYLARKACLRSYIHRIGLPFVDADHDTSIWEDRVQGLEHEPERGKRCTACFDLRLEHTADFAYQHGFSLFATTNGFSRWKDLDQVNSCGRRAALRHPGLGFLETNWRKDNGNLRGSEISRKEGFYEQKYCGCRFSMQRRTNKKGPSDDGPSSTATSVA